MRFECEIQKSEIAFLDLKIRIDQDLQISTDIYRKPTATNSLLHWQSWHPPALKKGIPIGQYLRACRNCSDQGDFLWECDNLYEKFRMRGYPKTPLRRAFRRARSSSRTELQNYKYPIQQEKIIRCIGTFDGSAETVKTILRKHWNILRADKRSQQSYFTLAEHHV